MTNIIVQIQIVTWNSRQYLPRLFAGIRRQAVDYDLVVVDNASSDGTVEMLKNVFNVVSTPRSFGEGGEKPLVPGIITYKGSLTPPAHSAGGLETTKKVTLIVNRQNRGFAAGHNQGFAICRTPFVLVLNPDVELSHGFLEKCLSIIQNDEGVGAVCGKLYRRLPQPPLITRLVRGGLKRKSSPFDKGGIRGSIIDSCGLKMRTWGQVVNIGEGQPDYGHFNSPSTVFGASGACALYRLPALESLADKFGIFDERFGTYKEDVDLAWRLSRAGWKTIFVPDATALHPRAVRHDNRGSRGDLINQLSIRNHLLMLKKNLGWRDWWRLPLIAGYELTKLVYVLLFERQNLTAYKIPNSKHQILNKFQLPNVQNSKRFGI